MGLKNPDIIYFTLFPWDHPYSSVSLSLTRILAQNHRVFYINHPFSVKDFALRYNQPSVQRRKGDLWRGRMRYEKIPGLPENVTGVYPPLTLPINRLPGNALYRTLARWNNRVVLNTIRKVIRENQLDDFIYLNCFNPYTAGVLPSSFGARLSIYQCIDDMSQEVYTARHGYRLEEEVMRRADIALVTSSNLYRLKSHLNPNTYILNNAADVSIFRQATEKKLPRPKEIATIKTPVIGFIGNLNGYRINYGLLKRIALRHQNKTLLLVGPLNSEDYKDYGLDQLPNVILTGGKNIHELPSYLQHMDCTIIPFLCNELTKSIYPLKINEYLAAGKAVVSSAFSEDIESFREVIRLAEDEDQFLHLIEEAIADNGQEVVEKRIQVARQNTWTARVEKFWNIVHRHYDHRNKQKIEKHGITE